jgi:hypothetical protein
LPEYKYSVLLTVTENVPDNVFFSGKGGKGHALLLQEG